MGSHQVTQHKAKGVAMSTKKKMTEADLQDAFDESRNKCHEALIMAATIDAMEQILALQRWHCYSVLNHGVRRRKWLKLRVNCGYRDTPLTRYVNISGPKYVRDVLNRELSKQPLLNGSEVHVSLGNRQGDSHILVLKVTSPIYPRI